MRREKFRIAIQPAKKTLDDFEKTWKKIETKGSKPDDSDDVVLFFSDSSQIAKILSPLKLLLVVCAFKRFILFARLFFKFAISIKDAFLWSEGVSIFMYQSFG